MAATRVHVDRKVSRTEFGQHLFKRMATAVPAEGDLVGPVCTQNQNPTALKAASKVEEQTD